jgi:NAD(P)-dependent dehydrogenase (short-subunit alcohol dehydrogenase family)
VNLKGPYFLMQRVAREMLARPGQLSNPAIVNVTSLSAYSVSTNRGDYCVSKTGLSAATQLFALRLADHGIRVFEVRPGIIDTDMTAPVRERYTQLIADGLTPIRRWGTPADVGRAVVALATGAIPFSTGEVVNVDGGFHLRKFPV